MDFLSAAGTASGVTPRPPPTPAVAWRTAKRTWLGFIVALVAGAAAGFAGMKFGSQLLPPLSGSKHFALIGIASLPFLWLAAVAFHEFGHIVGGWSGGGKFLLYVVGPLMWRRTPAGVHFAWNRNLNLAGGLAACLPLDPAQATPRRLARMIAGGPCFSLMLAVGALWAAAALDTPATVGAGVVQHIFLYLAGLSSMIFLVTVFPATAGGFKSDGRRFHDLLRGDTRSRQETAFIALTTAALAGVRPADYDPELVTQSLALKDGSLFDRYAHLTAYSHAADLGDFARAQGLLDYVLADETGLMPFVRDSVRCEYAWLLATQTEDTAAARAWLDAAGKLDFDPATRLRAEAAVLLAEGKPTEAAERAKAGLYALQHRSLSPAVNAFHADALEELLRKAQSRSPAPSS